LHSIGWIPLITNLLWVGAPPAQAPFSGVTPSAQESVSLEPGKRVEREFSGGQSHSYKITAISDQYLHIVVEQRGIDVAVALFTPDGKKIGEAVCAASRKRIGSLSSNTTRMRGALVSMTAKCWPPGWASRSTRCSDAPSGHAINSKSASRAALKESRRERHESSGLSHYEDRDAEWQAEGFVSQAPGPISNQRSLSQKVNHV
jgi:hypothetical protein